MEVSLGSTLLAGDPRLVDHIVGEVKSQGIFDQFRKECIADVDTKPAYQNLRTRVESSVNTFLCKQIWKPDMNKNQLRENLRKQIHDAAYLDAGVERIVDQVVNPKVYSVFMPQIEDVVYKFLGIERPKDREKNGTKTLKDLLPKDLDPVSPESDKNSLKDVSLESVDANIAAISGKNDFPLPKDPNKVEAHAQSNENVNDDLVNDSNPPNRQSENSKTQLECSPKNAIKNLSAANLNASNSMKLEEKTEEEEEDSPMFEPIDIMNFNESNDSHLSGISELTSHRSRSPDFSNDFSRDNLDFSNHDSQLSKVSSDSRLSIVTDFGLSNHASTPMPDTFKEDSNKERSIESSEPKCNKDNFKEIRDIDSSKVNTKEVKNSFETTQSKESPPEPKDSKELKSTKGTPDSNDSGVRETNDSKDTKDKYKDNDTVKTKSNKDKSDLKESKTHKDRDKEHRRRHSSHSSSKHDKTDKHSKDKYKEKSEKPRDSSEKSKEQLDKSKEVEKPKEDKKETDKKESAAKDLKDIYKEKIRELREKKELTEKEKLAKDPKDSKSTKESRDKKDSSRDRKDSKTSSSKSSSRYEDKSNKNDEKSTSKNDSRSSSKGVEVKESRNESKDRGKRDDKRQSKDSKESRSKSHSNSKSDSIDKIEKSASKKDSKNDLHSKESERNDRADTKRDIKSEGKKDSKTESQNKDYEKSEKLDSKRDSKTDSQNKERKRKDDKKTKAKDDHSSLRKNTSDRRSTDRDGSNGSNGKSSQKSSSSSISNSSKSGSTNLTKESSGTSNSSSETSDNVDISPSDGIKLPSESIHKNNESANRVKPFRIKITNENESEPDYYIESELTPKRVDLGQSELSLPLKKRPLQGDSAAPDPNDFKVKKPKFAKNFQEAKKLMKIRKKLEKQRWKEYEAAKEKFQMCNDLNNPEPSSVAVNDKKTPTLPDDERVQIIEVTDDDYEEPYPDLSMKEINISLEQQSLTSLENPLVFNPQEKLQSVLEKQSNLSAMEQSIRQSLQDMISDKKLAESGTPTEEANDSVASVKTVQDISTVLKENEKKSNQKKQTLNSIIDQQNEAQESKKSTTGNKDSSETIKSRCNNKNTGDKVGNENLPTDSDDNYNCLYFKADNERAMRFSKFVQSLELEFLEDETYPQNSSDSLEQILENLGGRIVSALPKTMAPPMPKRKHSTSPLMDILMNSTNNNNNRHKMEESTPEEESNTMKKRKLGRPKKQRAIPNMCAIQNLPNGENFVMPLSPESDVSASSDKNSQHLLKEDRSRQRSSQRYSSDDLYKPRPFFSSSSRRSRRSNQA